MDGIPCSAAKDIMHRTKTTLSSTENSLNDLLDGLQEAMLRDKYRLLIRLQKTAEKAKRGEIPEKALRQTIARYQKTLETSLRTKERRRQNRPRFTYPEHLPIVSKKNDIIEALARHQVIIISGDTGSGKSTQIPKMCLDAGRGIAGRIGCTQPRRIAATAIGMRIAEELGEPVGKSVGYKIRFQDKTNAKSYIKIMTDGILLAETQQDILLTEYDTILIDEAHERSLNIDFLLGILKTLLPRREDLKVIITSATLDTEKFSRAFESAPVIKVEGRMYPVSLDYRPLDPELEEAGEVTYVDLAVQTVEDLKKRTKPGDILIFMPTEQDIRETCERLEARAFSRTRILPLFSRLTASQQHRVFSHFSGQKIVVATNVAETSLTVPGIKYVIDTGLARIPRYIPRTRTTTLPVSPISKSSADQRKGRCGRVEDGICIRLYSEDDYVSRPEFTPPEILRSNLAEVILRMLSLKLGHVNSFPFVDPPNPRSVKDGFDLLVELGAIVRNKRGPSLTEKGKMMARIPLDPQISRMLLEAGREGCVEEMSIIASALSIQDPRERPLDKADQADQMHLPFKDRNSDFLSLLHIWNRYLRSWKELQTQNKMRKFCRRHFLSFVRMREWMDIHDQITRILKDQRIKIGKTENDPTSQPFYAALHRCILSGYLSNIAMKKEKNIYQAAKGREVMIFPGSTVFNGGAHWIVAAEMVKTTRLFARTVAKIEPRWIENIGKELCRSECSDPYWQKDRGEVQAFEKVTLFGLPIVSKRVVPFGRLNPERAHEIFVWSALVAGELEGSFSFLAHNRALVEKLRGLEDKARRRDILVSEQMIAGFYSRRLPGVYDVRTLKKHIEKAGGDEYLKMREEDLMHAYPDEDLPTQYPDHLILGDQRFRMTYRFSPGKEDDGVTVAIPQSMVSRFPAERLEWSVPGLLKEKITALIKTLPKRYRKQLIPVSNTVEIILSEMNSSERSLASTLSQFIYRRFGVDIPASQWSDEIPEHLKMRVSLTDHDGRECLSSRDIHLLRKQARSTGTGETKLDIWKNAQEKWERSGLTSWDFGCLPEQLFLAENLAAYPALVLEADGVAIKLCPSLDEARKCHQVGVKALFSRYLSKELKNLKRALKLPGRLMAETAHFGGPQAFERALYEHLVHRFFAFHIRREEDFQAHAMQVKPKLLPEGRELMELAVKVAQSFHQTQSTFQTLLRANRSNEEVRRLCLGLEKETDDLVPPDFLRKYSTERIMHLPRYLKALAIRAERAAYDMEKDRRKVAKTTIFLNTLKGIHARLSPHSSVEKKREIEAFRWMLEEFKVSTFAPELKTPYPVSEQRLKKKVEEIERMK
jgi:ATP-dependent helicase HrpA